MMFGSGEDGAHSLSQRVAPLRTAVLAMACLLDLVPAGPAHARFMVMGIDRKFDGARGKRETLEPARDEVLVFDIADPASPALDTHPTRST